MRVLCAGLPIPSAADDSMSSPWVTVGREYRVTAMLAAPGRPVKLQIITDDAHSLGWFESSSFVTVDESLPTRWRAQVRDDGILEIAPASWLVPGFWESYYDGEAAAVAKVESELRDPGD